MSETIRHEKDRGVDSVHASNLLEMVQNLEKSSFTETDIRNNAAGLMEKYGVPITADLKTDIENLEKAIDSREENS